MRWECEYVFWDGSPRGLPSWVVSSDNNPSTGDYVCRLIDDTQPKVIDNTGGRWARPIIDLDRPLARPVGGISPSNTISETPETMPSDVNILPGPWWGNTTVQVDNPISTGWDDAIEKLQEAGQTPANTGQPKPAPSWLIQAKESGVLWILLAIVGYILWKRLK